MHTPQDLHSRVAIVTGAGKGLGRAYALHLAARGAAILVNNRRHAGEADAQTSAAQTVAKIVDSGGRAMANWSDVCDPASGNAMVAQARSTFGALHIVVANAGIGTPGSFLKQDLAGFRQVFDTGFFGNLHLAHAAWPHLMAQAYGRVILTASSAGLYGDFGMGAYAASKAAVIGLARVLALEGQRKGVLVNVVAPYGYSQMTAEHMPDVMARSFHPSLVAPLVGWLASEACDVCGEVLVSGGGLVRRADTGETAGALLYEGGVAQTVHSLRERVLHSHPGAHASFLTFVQELDQLSKAT